MNWDALGAVAELVGATGVVASLLYLAGQVRSNSRVARQEAARSVLAKLNQGLDALTRDESMADIWLRGSQGLSNLTAGEQVRFSTLLLTVLRTYEELLSYEGGAVDWNWEGFHAQVAEALAAPGVAEWWEQRSHWFSSQFRDRVSAFRQDGVTVYRPLYAQGGSEAGAI